MVCSYVTCGIWKHMTDPTRTFNEKIACSVSMTHVAMTFLRAVYSEKSKYDSQRLQPDESLGAKNHVSACNATLQESSIVFWTKIMSTEIQAPKNIYSEGFRSYNLDLYPSPNNSQHQDHHMFSIENPYQPSFATVGW